MKISPVTAALTLGLGLASAHAEALSHAAADHPKDARHKTLAQLDKGPVARGFGVTGANTDFTGQVLGWTGSALVVGSHSTIADNAAATRQQQTGAYGF